MTDYKPGTVAVATVRGVPNVRVFRGEGFWRTAVEVGGNVTHYDYNGGVANDVRPLVVLDAPRVDLMTGADVLRREGWGDLADQIEAQTKPPRIPEPTRFGVVEASLRTEPARRQFVRADTDAPCWYDGERWADWEDLMQPVLIRDGIEGS